MKLKTKRIAAWFTVIFCGTSVIALNAYVYLKPRNDGMQIRCGELREVVERLEFKLDVIEKAIREVASPRGIEPTIASVKS